jgi:hypothetical protein
MHQFRFFIVSHRNRLANRTELEQVRDMGSLEDTGAGIFEWLPQGPARGRILLRGENLIGPNYILCPLLCKVTEGSLSIHLDWRKDGSQNEE